MGKKGKSTRKTKGKIEGKKKDKLKGKKKSKRMGGQRKKVDASKLGSAQETIKKLQAARKKDAAKIKKLKEQLAALENKCKTKAPASPDNIAAATLDKARKDANAKVKHAKLGKKTSSKANPKEKGKSSMKSLEERLRIAREKRQIADDELEIAHAEVAKMEIKTGKRLAPTKASTKKSPKKKAEKTKATKASKADAKTNKPKRSAGALKASNGTNHTSNSTHVVTPIGKLKRAAARASAAYQSVKNGSYFSTPEYRAKHLIPVKRHGSSDNARCRRCKRKCRKNPGCLALCYTHHGACETSGTRTDETADLGSLE